MKTKIFILVLFLLIIIPQNVQANKKFQSTLIISLPYLPLDNISKETTPNIYNFIQKTSKISH